MNKLFDKEGMFKENIVENMEFKDIVEEMGVALDMDGVVSKVNWNLINSMKDNKYSVDSDFIMYYFAIIISQKSQQSLYHIIDNWMWSI